MSLILDKQMPKDKVIEIQYVLHQKLTSPLTSNIIHTTTHY